MIDRASNLSAVAGIYRGSAAEHLAISLVDAHPRAVDYLRQAPVLVAGVAAQGLFGLSALTIGGIRNFQERCEQGLKLRDMMAAYRLAMPLRALSGQVIRQAYLPYLPKLSALHPSALALAVPADVHRQKRWLEALSEWSIRGKSQDLNVARFAWAAVQISRADVDKSSVRAVFDFAKEPGETWEDRWSWAQAEAATARWHIALRERRMTEAQKAFSRATIDNGKHLDTWEHEGLSFHALRTPGEIWAEGDAMHHCVKSYVGDVTNGRSHIISIKRAERRVATLEVVGKKVRQLKGPCNAKVADDVLEAAAVYASLRKPKVAA